MEQKAHNYHDPDATDRDIAFFELGIKLAALFHIAMGFPIQNNPEVLDQIALGLKKSIECQPFVKKAHVSLNLLTENGEEKYSKQHQYDYTAITGKNLRAEVEIQYKNWNLVGAVKWIPDLNYPLMFIKKISKLKE
ncbi:MAG: dihydroneopterin aldolase family protein [Promethearchaeota archaeon]